MNSEQAKDIFPTVEHWLNFNELANKRDSIREDWLTSATQLIRQHFADTPADGWAMEPWGAPNRDTKWFLEGFGPDSLCLAYGWYYELQLRIEDLNRFNTDAITQALESSDYRELKQAFSRIDRYMGANSKLMERGNFEFGLPSDRNLSELEITWCAGFKTEQFVEQAIAKIERFVRDETVTAQIRQLNEIGRAGVVPPATV